MNNYLVDQQEVIKTLRKDLKRLKYRIETMQEKYYTDRNRLHKLTMEAGTIPEQAFEKAIHSGILSEDPTAYNYAGDFMYMGKNPTTGKDAFKHCATRQYLKY